MTNDKEMDNMPIWQDHEKRITVLETGYDRMSYEMQDVKKVVKDESEAQKKLLNRLIEHHLSTNKFKLSKMWQLILNIFGAGGIIVTVIYAAVQFLGN